MCYPIYRDKKQTDSGKEWSIAMGNILEVKGLSKSYKKGVMSAALALRSPSAAVSSCPAL